MDLEPVLRDLMDCADAYVYVMDTELRYLFLNRRALQEAYRGLPLEAVVGKRGRDFFPPDTDGSDLDDLEYHDRYVLETGKSIQVYETLMGVMLYSSKWPLRDERGEIYAVGGVSFDVTSVVNERVRGGTDLDLMVKMMDSSSRMARALMRMTAP